MVACCVARSEASSLAVRSAIMAACAATVARVDRSSSTSAAMFCSDAFAIAVAVCAAALAAALADGGLLPLPGPQDLIFYFRRSFPFFLRLVPRSAAVSRLAVSKLTSRRVDIQ